MCVSISNVTLNFFSACEPNVLHSKAGRGVSKVWADSMEDKRLVAEGEQLMWISKTGRKKEVDIFPYKLCKHWLNREKNVV